MEKLIGKNIPVARIISFSITGINRNGKRFKKLYKQGENNRTAYETVMMFDLSCGSVWCNLEDGTRRLLKRI